jgi:hypothetical protein
MTRSLRYGRNRRKTTQDRLGRLIMAGIVLVALAVGGAYAWVVHTTPDLDTATLCPAVGPVSLTVVLLDTTDPLTPVQREALNNRLENIKADVPKHGAIALYSVVPSGRDVLRPEIMLCNPGRGSEVSSIAGNPRLVEKRWREAFSERMDAVLSRVLARSESSSSPIMESIQATAVTAFGRSSRPTARRLVVVSDMIQHTVALSQYKTLSSFQDFEKTEGYRSIRADLRDVDAELLYVRRPTKRSVQGRAHIEFWQSYFGALGATLTRVVALEG